MLPKIADAVQAICSYFKTNQYELLILFHSVGLTKYVTVISQFRLIFIALA